MSKKKEKANKPKKVILNQRFDDTFRQCIHNSNFMIGFFIILSVILIAVFSGVLEPYPYDEQMVGPRLEGPSWEHWFGTDNYGRDELSRVIEGSKLALWVAFLGASVELALGITIGLAMGYFGKWVDRTFSFLTDLTWCIPGTILALAVVTIIGKGLTNTIIAVSLVAWAGYARPVRSKTMSLKNMAFIETGRAFGESSRAIMFKYIFPNVVPSLIVMVSMNLPGTIMSTTTLSYLGLGSQPPSADWGLALSDGMKFISRAPWLSIYPGLALVYTTLGFNLLGEGLRDILDPHMKSQ
ncbi:MAG: ABC transporter permease [Clostridia bacterium]|nr:ABC transporter permease [Clostridia bacterium]